MSSTILQTNHSRDNEARQALIFENQEAPSNPKARSSLATSINAKDLSRRIWLTTKEAAEYLGTSMGGVRNRVYRSQLKPYKPFGYRGRCYFKRTDLDRLIEGS